MTIRPATVADVPAMYQLVCDLAEYERARDKVETTEAVMRRDGFETDPPAYRALVAEVDGAVVGMALCCYHYSTWRGQRLYLEDLIVNPSQRGAGIGAALLEGTKQLALSLGCTGVNWQVLEWNEPAIRFYERLGVRFDSEWVNCYWDLRKPTP